MSTQGKRDFRPFLHYTPEKGWINDPNGLVYEDGVYHLFAQHYPDDTKWGPMHWIHATSRDLLHWDRKGIAIAPDKELGLIFSGSAVIDRGNTSGLGDGCDPMIAMFTHHGKWEQESIAYSDDRVHFTKYAGNPVIPTTGLKDFRDPKVFRNDIKNCWSVVLAAGDHAEVWASDDFKAWRKTGEFGKKENKLGGIFECTDLFPLESPDGGVVWVAVASMALDRLTGGSRTQYFLGQFDGDTFRQTVPFDRAELIDWGYDNYAAVTFNGSPERIMIGWGTSWSYAAEEPTGEYCGLMTYARKLKLVKTPMGLRLSSLPIVPDHALTAAAPSEKAQTSVALDGELFHVRVEADGPFMAFIENDAGERFAFGRSNENAFFTDRTRAGANDFSDVFSLGLFAVASTPRTTFAPAVMDVYFDKCIFELFADDGAYVNTTLVYPSSPYTRATLIGNGRLSAGRMEA